MSATIGESMDWKVTYVLAKGLGAMAVPGIVTTLSHTLESPKSDLLLLEIGAWALRIWSHAER